MNPITDELPAPLDMALADFSHATGAITYNHITDLGRAWPRLTDAEKARIRGLADEFAAMGEPCEDNAAEANMLIGQLASAVKDAGNAKPENPGIGPGDLVLYKNGDSYELGLVKRVLADGAFVYYSEGDTAAKTPFDCLHRIVNAFAVRSVSLGGRVTNLINGRAGDLAGEALL